MSCTLFNLTFRSFIGKVESLPDSWLEGKTRFVRFQENDFSQYSFHGCHGGAAFWTSSEDSQVDTRHDINLGSLHTVFSPETLLFF
jgi:hypothetical protein